MPVQSVMADTDRRTPSSPAARRPGGQAARRPGGPAARRPGGQAARRPGGPAARRPLVEYVRSPSATLNCKTKKRVESGHIASKNKLCKNNKFHRILTDSISIRMEIWSRSINAFFTQEEHSYEAYLHYYIGRKAHKLSLNKIMICSC